MNEMHSVVAPMFNEELVAERFIERTTDAMSSIPDYEIIVVDDGSRDRTHEKLLGLSEIHPNLKVIKLARNFGHQCAISAGIAMSQGDTVTVIDADLQDPPELIPEMISKWREGADIVFAVRDSREGETLLKRATAKFFYRFIRSFTKMDIPLDAGDFRLMSRRAADALCAMPERNRFVRGLVAWVGLRRGTIHYHRDARAAGETKYTLPKMMQFAVDGVLSFSSRPLRLASWLGFASSALAAVLAVIFVALRLFSNQTVEGWTSLVVVVLFMGGIQLVTLGIIGEYIARVHDEVRGRPLYLVESVHNFPQDVTERISGSVLPIRPARTSAPQSDLASHGQEREPLEDISAPQESRL